MGRADYYAPGQWNFFCDLCGKKTKSSEGVKTWDNFWVCRYHKEARNPQDFVRGVEDDQSLPWERSEAPDQFVASTFQLLQENGFAILQEEDDFDDSYSLIVT